MKLRILFIALLSFFAYSGQAQLLEPVKWSIDAEKASETEVDVKITASIDETWYLYSQYIDEGGPIPSNFDFGKEDGFTLVGETTEESDYVIEGLDKIFDMYVKKMKEEVVFTQRLSIEDASKVIEGELLFQTCDDEQCLAPTTVPFAVNLSNLESAIYEENLADVTGKQAAVAKGSAIVWPEYDDPVSDCQLNAASADTTVKGKWTIFLWGLAGGLLALLTPCVFPMIPLTVAFFTKRHEKKGKGVFDSLLYGLFIFGIYTAVAIPFQFFTFSQDTFYQIATSPWLNLVFFFIFLFFALSFFGFYELTLPSSWTNKADKASSGGGFFGIFFMALVLVLVSFSCTGPIVGGLMGTAFSSAGGPIKVLFGMMGFGIALGLPFGLFAMFPGLLKKLPQSGGWMNSVKVFIGFLELALALKFLSNADLVKQWGLVKYEVFLGIWLLITLATAAYMFGLFKFPHDSKKQKISIGRKITGIAAIGLSAYIFTGFTGNILSLFSGFPPPRHYALIDQNKENSIHGITDFDEGIAKAKAEDKPILVDFTGWSCVNCRKVEENIWTDPEVAKRLTEDVVLVSLYVDDRSVIDEEEQYRSDKLSKTINTIGEKWTDFEASSFGHITQPYYALITADGQLLTSPIAYTSSVNEYINFLECGTEAYKTL